jgi:hypothetical protein
MCEIISLFGRGEGEVGSLMIFKFCCTISTYEDDVRSEITWSIFY